MPDAVVAAVIAASVALVTVYCTQFLGERYRRFHEGSAIAAGLAGELASYAPAVPMVRVVLRAAQENICAGRKHQLKLRSFEKPVDRFFDEVVGKLGLLGPQFAENIIYVYSNLNAFRVAWLLISEKHQEMDSSELALRLTACADAMERANETAPHLVGQLRARSTESFIKIPFFNKQGVGEFRASTR